MSKPDEQFLPEQVDEQIDALSQPGNASPSSNAHLVANLRAVYQEDEEIVGLVWTRLAKRAAERRRANAGQIPAQSQLLSRMGEQQKGPQPMQLLFNEKPPKRKRFRWLEILAAVLVVAILVGGMVFLLKSRQPSLGSARSASPTPATHKLTPTPVSDPGGLYVTTNNGIDRITRATGKVVWHAGSGLTNSLLVEGEIVIFSGGNTVGPGNYSNYYVEAVNAADGHQLWRKAYGTAGNLEGANGIVAVDSCPAEFSASAPCTIDGLKASNGQKLWSYPSSQGSIWETYQNGVVYGISYENFFALNLANGMSLWQKTLQKYPNQESNTLPFVSGKELYFSSCDQTKQTPTYQSCYFFAFNATNGAELWHKPLGNSAGIAGAVPTVMDGVVYVAAFSGIIYAFGTGTGATLWTYNAGGGISSPLLSSHGLLYAEVGTNSTPTRLLALKVTSSSHSVAWSQNIDLITGRPGTGQLTLENGLIYILDSNNNILAFQATNGDRAQGYHPPAGVSIGSFTFVP